MGLIDAVIAQVAGGVILWVVFRATLPDWVKVAIVILQIEGFVIYLVVRHVRRQKRRTPEQGAPETGSEPRIVIREKETRVFAEGMLYSDTGTMTTGGVVPGRREEKTVTTSIREKLQALTDELFLPAVTCLVESVSHTIEEYKTEGIRISDKHLEDWLCDERICHSLLKHFFMRQKLKPDSLAGQLCALLASGTTKNGYDYSTSQMHRLKVNAEKIVKSFCATAKSKLWLCYPELPDPEGADEVL